MRRLYWGLGFLLALGLVKATGAEFSLIGLDAGGGLAWTNAAPAGIALVEQRSRLDQAWTPLQNVFTTDSVGGTTVPLDGTTGFLRVESQDISATPAGFDNLVSAYGVIETIAGAGQFGGDYQNNWLPEYEGGPAVDANFSRPHFALADAAGNVFIADKDSHAILKVTPDGNIHTAAGTHVGGDNGDGPAPATTLQLNTPTGEWLGANGTLYILDTGNGKVRRLTPDGMMSTLFGITNGITSVTNGLVITNGIAGGRGLWVSPDESVVYFTSDNNLNQWTPTAGVTVLNSTFIELGNIAVRPDGQIIATDRLENRVWLVDPAGPVDANRTAIAGSGGTSGGGDGQPALQTALAGVRGVALLPNGGYLLATHKGSQVWYVDTAGIIHLFLNGKKSFHSGDGDYFRSVGFKVSENRSVTLDPRGNIYLVENDSGYVRRISFLPFIP